jgi:TonB-linked SusC/RagA family outer membrane protein
MAGANREKFYDKNMSAYIEGFLSNALTEINAGSSNKNVSGTSSGYGIRSFFGRLSYAFNNKYLLEANLRYDGSSRFSEEKRWGGFPSVSAGWRISEEPFMSNQRLFSSLKIRASWGKLGNDQIGLYKWIPTLALGNNYTFNGVVSSGVAARILANPDISWETATKTDIGFEAGFLDGRLNIEFDYFNELREDILRNINMPWTVGALEAPTANLASVRNRGWEFSANYAHTTGDLHLSAGFNVTYVKNIVTKIPDPQIGFFTLKEGEPMNAFYMWKATGLFQSQNEIDNSAIPVGKVTAPGDIKFEDIGGPEGKPDGVIDANDRQIVGKPFPTWTYGASLTAAYRGFDLGAMIQGVADVDSYLGGDIFFPYVNGAGVSSDWTSGNTWTPEHPQAKLPRLLRYFAPTYNYDDNSFWLQDASFLRIKNLQLGYTFSSRLFVWAKSINSVRLFVNAQNPFTFTRFKGLDPERTLTATAGGQYPNIRILTAGVVLKF